MSGSSSRSSGSSGEDEQKTVILDPGSGYMKCGFAGDESPRAVFKTIAGKPTVNSVSLISSSSGDGKNKVYVGEEAAKNSAVLEIHNPITDGLVTDFELLYHIFEHAFCTELRVNPKSVKVLVTEAANNPDKNRWDLFKMLFERFVVPAGQCQVQAVLALYASGRTTGLVFDSGDGVSHTVPVFKGYGLPTSVVATKLAGRSVTKQCIWALGKYHKMNIENENNSTEIARALKEKVCRMAENFDEEFQALVKGAAETIDYEFKDGSVITCRELIVEPAEVLHRPNNYGYRAKSVSEILKKTIDSLNIEMRRDMFSNTVLSGGTTCIADYEKRFLKEYKLIVPANSVNDVKVSVPSDRKYAVFLGGSILTCLASFAGSWITLEDYQERGIEACKAKKLF